MASPPPPPPPPPPCGHTDPLISCLGHIQPPRASLFGTLGRPSCRCYVEQRSEGLARLHGARLPLGGVAVGQLLQVLGHGCAALLERLDQVRRVALLLFARIDECDGRALVARAPCRSAYTSYANGSHAVRWSTRMRLALPLPLDAQHHHTGTNRMPISVRMQRRSTTS